MSRPETRLKPKQRAHPGFRHPALTFRPPAEPVVEPPPPPKPTLDETIAELEAQVEEEAFKFEDVSQLVKNVFGVTVARRKRRSNVVESYMFPSKYAYDSELSFDK